MTPLRPHLDFLPRGLSRTQAAQYVGVGTTTFDKLVADGKMPKPKCVGTRKIYDRHELDMAFDDINGDDSSPNPWDEHQ